MRILVQDFETAMYFREDGPPTPEPEMASDFGCSEEALRFVVARKIEHAQMVVRCSGVELAAVPLPPRMTPA